MTTWIVQALFMVAMLLPCGSRDGTQTREKLHPSYASLVKAYLFRQ